MRRSGQTRIITGRIISGSFARTTRIATTELHFLYHNVSNHYRCRCGESQPLIVLPRVTDILFFMADPIWYGWVRVLRIYISIHWHNDEHRWTSFVHVNRPSAYQPSVIHSPPLLDDCFSWLKSWTICSTLIDSTPGVYKAWETFATDYALGDYREITHATHGRRLYDTLRELCKIKDETKLLVSRNCPT